MKVEIVNKAKLPPDRLADALFAKSELMLKSESLREAARLVPNDPVYWYQQASSNRKLLERALAVDPNYLPAIYRYALTKPTHEQQMQALEDIAKIDMDNAKPYYIMALLKFGWIREGRLPTKESQYTAFAMTGEEWDSVTELIKQGNARPVLRATTARIPSVSDIRVSTGGKVWPDAAVQSNLETTLNEMNLGDLDVMPWTITFNAVSRQLLRDAAQRAREFYWKGERDKALETLDTAYRFCDKFASCEPHRVIPILVAHAMRSIAEHAEVQIQQVPANRARLLELYNRKIADRKALKAFAPLLERQSVTLKDVKTSPSEGLLYIDYQAEEELATRMLMDLGFTKP